MSVIIYKPADVLSWFGQDSKKAKGSARKQGMDLVRAASQAGIVRSFQSAMDAASSLGRSAAGDIVQARIEVTEYVFHEAGLEVTTLTKQRKIGYDQIRQIVAKSNDKFQILYNGGTITIKPIAHLAAGKLRVPIGWQRNGMEVPYSMLVDELSARCNVEIDLE